MKNFIKKKSWKHWSPNFLSQKDQKNILNETVIVTQKDNLIINEKKKKIIRNY